MSRVITVGAAQLGPIQKSDDRASVVARLVALLRQGAAAGCDLVVFPELALTTFFPRWFVDDITQADHWYETEMPSAVTAPLFDEAKRLSVGFCLGYAEITPEGRRFNTQILVAKDLGLTECGANRATLVERRAAACGSGGSNNYCGRSGLQYQDRIGRLHWLHGH